MRRYGPVSLTPKNTQRSVGGMGARIGSGSYRLPLSLRAVAVGRGRERERAGPHALSGNLAVGVGVNESVWVQCLRLGCDRGVER